MTCAHVSAVRASSTAFASHHSVPLPRRGGDLVLGGEREGGGFGAIRPVVSLDQAGPGRPLLAKVFDPDVLARGGGAEPVIALIAGLCRSLDARGGPGWQNAVLALPFSLCEADLDGETLLVALMLDLAALGYEQPPFADRHGVPGYMRRSGRERIELGRRLAERLSLLEAVGFLHGDLNPENVMVNLTTLDVQVIDFDSGALLVTGAERPRTAGKADECMPPEVKGVRPDDPPADPQLYTPAAERFSIGSLVGYFLLGVHPGFFLRQISRTTIEAYSRQAEDWPEIDTSGSLFTAIPQNQRAYTRMLDNLRELPSGTRELFAQFFRAGLDGAARPRPDDWSEVLAGLQRPPEIDTLTVDPLVVLEGDPITISWRVPNAAYVELHPGGRQPAEGEITQVARQTMRIELDAFNDFGRSTQQGPLVVVAQLPRLQFVAVPDFPPLRLSASLPLVPAPSALATSPAKQGPTFPISMLIAPRSSDTSVVQEGPLPAPPRFTDLLAPITRTTNWRTRR